MLIDWFTVVAQAVNFLLLVWLLKRFLYQPILQAIDKREQRIAALLREAEQRSAEAEKERSSYQQKNAAFEQERAALLSQATTEARAESRRLLEEARGEYNALRARFQESLREERQDLGREITERARQEVFAMARKALADLADYSLEEQIANVFVRRLNELDGEEKQRLALAFRSSGRPAVIRSSFGLSAAQQQAIEKVLKTSLAPDVQVQFETRPEQISGIEFTMNGYKIAWSIADYLSSLEKNIAELLNGKPKPEAEADKLKTKPDEKRN